MRKIDHITIELTHFLKGLEKLTVNNDCKITKNFNKKEQIGKVIELKQAKGRVFIICEFFMVESVDTSRIGVSYNFDTVTEYNVLNELTLI